MFAAALTQCDAPCVLLVGVHAYGPPERATEAKLVFTLRVVRKYELMKEQMRNCRLTAALCHLGLKDLSRHDNRAERFGCHWEHSEDSCFRSERRLCRTSVP